MDQATRLFVRERAGDRCEYCQRTQAESPMAKLQVEHILPIKHGGGDDLANLALACLACNLHKGPNLTGIDPLTGAVVELFHPRRQRWEEHFAWEGCRIVGQTAVGRTTVRVLEMNSADRLKFRLARR